MFPCLQVNNKIYFSSTLHFPIIFTADNGTLTRVRQRCDIGKLTIQSKMHELYVRCLGFWILAKCDMCLFESRQHCLVIL